MREVEFTNTWDIVATAPTVYGIETPLICHGAVDCLPVATAPTVYGIETSSLSLISTPSCSLQQHLPFTVLKPVESSLGTTAIQSVATAPTVYGIETNF